MYCSRSVHYICVSESLYFKAGKISHFMIRISALLIPFLLFTIIDVEAQRRAPSAYESLLQRTDQPSSYIDHIILPETDSTAIFSVFFRLDYDFIPFLRKRSDVTPPTPDSEFFAPLRMGVEIFEGSAERSRRGSSAGNSIFRDSWQDTIWVETFEDTKSRFDYTQGFISTNLSEGAYNYELQLGRAQSVRETQSRKRDFTVPDYSSLESASIYLFSDLEADESTLNGTLLNFGNNVLYGQNYSLLIALPNPDQKDPEKLQVKIHTLKGSGDSDVENEPRYEAEISADDFLHLNNSEITRSGDDLLLSAQVTQNAPRFAFIEIPNRNFENARYRITVTADESDEVLARKAINSQWLDMPVSLYNLDVAIDMMSFIVSDDQLRRLNSGSSSERERKFREFWAERDPDPDTEYNPLMAEYFSRIDYAYQNFTTMQRPGYETDQGRAYILYGQPRNIERRFPSNAPTREIWEYRDRTLIFEATTGFGDFRLISES